MYPVLVVEDDYWIRSSIVEMIGRIGGNFKVIGEAVNGTEGFNLVQELCPMILITDITMPGMDGLTVIRQIHEAQYPIVSIIVSGFDNFTYAQQAIHYGVTEYLLKPVMEEALAKALENSKSRLELLQPVYKLVMEIQHFTDQIMILQPHEIMLEQARLVKSIIKDRHSHAVFKLGLLRMIASKLCSVMEFYYPEFRVSAPEYATEDALSKHVEELCEQWCKWGKHNPNRRSFRLIMKKACDYVEKNYMQEQSLAQVAEFVGLSVSHFSALFKQHSGDSFVHYLNRYRIEQAKQLLLDPELKVYQVADMVGFSSTPYFNRVFKTTVGETPNDYRNGMGI